MRSAGPGGQNVNKVASKVRVRVDLDLIEGISKTALDRLRRLVARRVDEEGRLIVTSQRTRDQIRNLDDARARIRALVAQALVAPRVRRPTRPSGHAVERRLATKRHRATAKRSRRRPSPDSE